MRYFKRIFLTGVMVLSAFIASYALAQGPGGGGCCDFWQPGWMHRDMWGQGAKEMEARMQRHWTFMHEGIPEAYANARSTIKPTKENISAGGKLYSENCASCHGKKGLGDGEAAKGLSPSPALLAYLIQRPVSVDEFLLWSISEGGTKFGTAMPAFKDSLSKDQIWQIVAYMRSGFPEVKE